MMTIVLIEVTKIIISNIGKVIFKNKDKKHKPNARKVI